MADRAVHRAAARRRARLLHPDPLEVPRNSASSIRPDTDRGAAERLEGFFAATLSLYLLLFAVKVRARPYG